jgi:hypothetical protein
MQVYSNYGLAAAYGLIASVALVRFVIHLFRSEEHAHDLHSV